MQSIQKADEGLVVSGLTKTWAAHKALIDVSFQQETGSIFGIAGDNGAGKSTLLKILASVLPRDGGQVSFQGISLDDRSRWRGLVGYVPQELALDDRLRVRDSLLFWASARGFTRQERKAILQLAMADPLISDFLDKPVRDCSGGMARRVSLIVGLLGDPHLLLLDEPFAGADRDSRLLMINRLQQLKEAGRTILVSSHEDQVLDMLCDRILFLQEGRLQS